MANRKASAFSVLSSIVDGTYFAMAESGTNYKSTALKIWEYISAKIKGSAATLSDAGTISLSANDYVISLVVSNSSGSDITFSVGTAADGTDVLEDEVITDGSADEVYVINYCDSSASTLHFTLSSDQISVRPVKL